VSLKKWDEDIYPYLANIEVNCGLTKYYAEKVAATCLRMTERPGLLTKAEDGIDKCITEIEGILSVLKQAKADYNATPLMETSREKNQS